EKALRYRSRGIVGVDIAGPRPGGGRYDYTQIREHVDLARDGGLGVTIHVGEEGGDHGVEEISEVVEALRPDRLGHGILAARDPGMMRTHLRDEFDLLLRIGALSEEELGAANARGHEASFLGGRTHAHA